MKKAVRIIPMIDMAFTKSFATPGNEVAADLSTCAEQNCGRNCRQNEDEQEGVAQDFNGVGVI